MKVNREIEDLVEKYIEGQCSYKDIEVLEELLETNADACDYYLKMLALHEHLCELSTVRGAVNSEIVPIGSLVEREKKSSVVMALTSAAALVALLLIAFSIVRVRPAPSLFVFSSSPGTQFKVTHTSLPGKKNSANGLEKGSLIELTKGVLELESADGTKAVMQGTTTLTVVSEEHFSLSRGKVWFRASKKKGALLVTTPLLNIRDLGTEFGVIAGQDSRLPEVHVFEGKVKIDVKDGLKVERFLEAGEAAKLEFPGRFDSFESNESLFFSRLPAGEPYTEISFEEVKGVGLEPAKGSLPCAQSMNLRWMSDSTPEYTQGVVGKAARFNGKNSAIVTDYWGPDAISPFSLSIWVRYSDEEALEERQVILGWGSSVPNENLEFFSLNIQPRDGVGAVAQLVVDRQQYIGETNLADEEWHHLIVTRGFSTSLKKSSQFKIYVDGIEETVDSCSFSKHSKVSQTLSSDLAKRRFLIGKSDSNPRRPQSFSGDLDELRVYKNVISEAEIAELSSR